MEKIISITLLIAEIYLAAGFLFAIYFLTRGIHKTDEGAQDSSPGFKLIIAPGVIAFWVFLLKKLFSNK